VLTTLLPWAALLLALAAWFVRDGEKETTESRTAPMLMGAALLFALLAVGAGFIWNEPLRDLLPTSYGFAAGIGVVLLAALLAGRLGQPREPLAMPIALGAFGAGIWTLVSESVREPYQLGAAAGAGLAGWLLSLGGQGSAAARTGLILGLAISADVLGSRGMGGNCDHAGSILALVAALATLLAVGLPRKPDSAASMRLIGAAVGIVVLALGGWLLATRHLFLNDIWILFGGSALAAILVAWLVPDEVQEGSVNFILGVILWLGIATLAFGLRKGFGMSICALGGAATLTLIGRTRALLTLGPLAMLAIYRVFRELHTDASRALDIGQHYALVGIAIGIVLPLLATEWTARRRADTSGSVAAFLWMPCLLAVPFLAGVVLAAKGYVGVLAGLGFASVVDGLKGAVRLNGMALQVGLGFAMAGGYRWLSSKVDLARDDKIAALTWVAVALGVVAIGIALLSKQGREQAAGSSE